MIDRIPVARDTPAPSCTPARAACVVVRSAADIRLAAGAERPFTLLSARGAASFAGSLLWLAIARGAREAFPALVADDILDCADAPGRALEALRLGQRLLVLDEMAPGFADVAARATSVGALVLRRRPPCFDPGFAPRITPVLRARLLAFLERAALTAAAMPARCHDRAPPDGVRSADTVPREQKGPRS